MNLHPGCYPGLYSLWGFAPLLPEIMAAARFHIYHYKLVRRGCMQQRRAESPIRIQPRAAPWVKRFQQTCALKEQKEGERTSISLSPVALTARQLVNELTPRVLPWAVFLLGLRPVLARNHCCCTFRWIIFFLVLRPLIACIVAAARCHIYHYNLV